MLGMVTDPSREFGEKEGWPSDVHSITSFRRGCDCSGRASVAAIAWLARDSLEYSTYSLLSLGNFWGPLTTSHALTKRKRPFLHKSLDDPRLICNVLMFFCKMPRESRQQY